jgi:hypothetical protein
MDLEKTLKKGHSRAQSNAIVSYIAGNPERLKALVKVYLNGPYRMTQRAAWPLSLCVEKWPYLIDPHLGKILNYLKTPGAHDAVRRNTMRLLQFIDIPKRHRGQVADICFEYLQNRKVAVAIRVFSMTVLSHIIKDQPDMKRELKLLLEDHLPYSSAAFINRAKKVLKEIE